jgi:hypothetical protein
MDDPRIAAEDLAQARGEYFCDDEGADALEMLEAADRARRMLDGWREPDEYLQDLLGATWSAYLIHNGSQIVERKP